MGIGGILAFFKFSFLTLVEMVPYISVVVNQVERYIGSLEIDFSYVTSIMSRIQLNLYSILSGPPSPYDLVEKIG